jgi:ABC-2 type transport system permease protein
MTEFLASLKKEFILLGRDWHGVVVLFLMPAVFILIMSVAIQGQDDVSPELDMGMVLDGRNPDDELLLRLLDESDNLRVRPFDKTQRQQAELLLARADLDFLVITAPFFSEALLPDPDSPSARGSVVVKAGAGIETIVWLMIQSSVKEAYAKTRLNRFLASMEGVESGEVSQEQIAELNEYVNPHAIETTVVDAAGRAVARPSAVQHSVPAWLIFGMFFVVIPISNVMVAERQTGARMRLQTINVPAGRLLLSKLIPYLVINEIQLLLMLGVGVLIVPWFGGIALSLPGPLPAYALLGVSISLAALGYGFLISVTARTTEQATVIGGGGNILLAALGGIMVPAFVMPPAMQTLAHLSPMAWALSGFHDILLHRAPVSAILPEVGMLSGFGALLLWIASRRYRRALQGGE